MCLQLKAYCRTPGWDWGGTVMDFLAHIDKWEEDLAKLPDWVKEANKNRPLNITPKDEVFLPTSVLEQIQSNIPNSSLVARGYMK